MSEEFKFKGFWGSKQLRPFVEYSRGSTHFCIYCGSIADTREHVPSKAFLNDPLPSDLPTLPTCYKCNNSFSADELYTNTYIECVKTFSETNNSDVLEIQNTDRKEVKEAKLAVKQAFANGVFPKDERIERILCKLALGHIVYKLSRCYNFNSFQNAGINYTFKCAIDHNTWESLETIEQINDEVLPEIGSRAFENIFILEACSFNNSVNDCSVHQLFMDWTDIQDGVYRYIAFYNDSDIAVKMVIRDYLYAEIRLPG